MPTPPLPPNSFAHMRRLALSMSLSLLLAACNSDNSSESAPPPTELPFSVEVQGPAANNALGTAVAFSANVADPSNKLKYQWQFGDGESSSQANPTHSYAKAGVYRVQLIVTNEVGATRVTTADVSVADSSIISSKLCSGDNNSGWCWQQPLPTGNMLNDFTFVDQTHGWAVGEMGTILSSSDGGVSWQPQKSGTELPLSKVVFTSAQDGWVLASNGTILKTANGGASWTVLGYKQGIQLQTFGASDANNAWVQSEYPRQVLITSDGGSSWSTITPPSSDYISRYIPVNASVVWAQMDGMQSSLLRTLNGGKSWETVTLPALASGWSRRINNLVVAGANEAWMTGEDYGVENGNWSGNSFAFKTSDGGKTWQTFTLYPGGMQYLQFANANVGFAIPSYANGLLRSADGGVTWERLLLPTNGYFYSSSQLKVLSDKRLLLRDYEGRTFASSDAGTSWQEQTIGPKVSSPSITGLWFFDSREGIATGSDGSLARTLDGGQTWVTSVPANSGGWSRPQFMADGTGWVLAGSSTIYRSTDKGKTWVAPVSQNSTNLYGVVDYHFANANNGSAVAFYPTSTNGKPASIFRTTDGGFSWVPVDGTGEYSGLKAIRFADANVGVAVGGSGLVLLTTNGGASWSARSSGVQSELNRVWFIDSNTAIAVGNGGTIVRSTDRGLTWKKIPAASGSNLFDVRFVSSKFGWAVGDQGAVLITQDGGLSWSAQSSASSTSFNSVFFVNEQTGWIGGSGGAIMATATGGR